MKIKVTFKDPDGVWESISESVTEHVNAIEGLDAEERDELKEYRHEAVSEKLKKWIEYGEYLTVAFDTETGTATVIPV
jgi:hypothetical protein